MSKIYYRITYINCLTGLKEIYMNNSSWVDEGGAKREVDRLLKERERMIVNISGSLESELRFRQDNNMGITTSMLTDKFTIEPIKVRPIKGKRYGCT